MTYVCRILEQRGSSDEAKKECTKRFKRVIEFATEKHAYPITVVIVIRQMLLIPESDRILREHLTPIDKRIGFFEIPSKPPSMDDVDDGDTTYWQILFNKFRIKPGPGIAGPFTKMDKCMLTVSMNCSHEIYSIMSYPSDASVCDNKINTGEKDWFHTYIPIGSKSAVASSRRLPAYHYVAASIAPDRRQSNHSTEIRVSNSNQVQKTLNNMYNWLNAMCQLSDTDELDEHLRSAVLFQDFNLAMMDHVDFLKFKIFNHNGREMIYAPNRFITSQIKDLAKWISLDGKDEFISWPWYLYMTMRDNKLSFCFASFVNSLFGTWHQTIGYQLEYLNALDVNTNVCRADDSNNDFYFFANKIAGCKISIDNNLAATEKNSFYTANFLFCRQQVFYKVMTNPNLINDYFYINLTQLARYNDIFYVYESMVYKIRFEFSGSKAYLIYQTMEKQYIDYDVLFLDSRINQNLMEQIVSQLGLYMVQQQQNNELVPVNTYNTCLVMISHEPEKLPASDNNNYNNFDEKLLEFNKWPGLERIERENVLDLNVQDILFNTSLFEHSAIFNIHLNTSNEQPDSIHCIVYEIELTHGRHSVKNKILKKQLLKFRLY